MVFQIEGKVALVTGSARGIGLAHVKQLLQSGAKGVTIADINSENGEAAAKELQNEYGSDKVIFVQTDISNSTSFENAFELTLKHFKNVDILINNAAFTNDNDWEKSIDVNLKGTIHGVTLGMEKYLRNHKQGEEAVILNTASLSVMNPVPAFPVYTSTKYAVFGLTKCWGDSCHFERTKVRVIGICPGFTDTLARVGIEERVLNTEYSVLVKPAIDKLYPDLQSPNIVAEEAIKLLEKAPNGSIWIVENSQPAYEYKMADRNNYKNNVLK